jgi:cytochrome c oxidase subunit 2
LQRPWTARRVLAGLAGAAAAAALAPSTALADGIAPESPHSPNADDIATIYWVMLAVAVAIVVGVNLALLGAVGRYRAARGREPSRFRGADPIQLRVGAVLSLAALAIFLAGVVFTERARDVDPSGPDGLQASSLTRAQLDLALPEGDSEPLEISASGQQWLWRYEYPDGTFSYYELVVPVDTPVVLNLESTDVVHRWWVPQLAGKFDAIPDRSNKVWFKADEEGTYEGRSTAFSGAAYASMRTAVRVVSVADYEAWLEQQAADIAAAQDAAQTKVAAEAETPAAAGSATEGGESPEAGQ